MNPVDAQKRQEEMKELLAWIKRRQAEPSVHLAAAVCPQNRFGDFIGFYGNKNLFSPGAIAPSQAGNNHEFEAIFKASPVAGLQVDDYLYLLIKSDLEGHLNLFNLGTSGHIRKFALTDPRVEAGQTILVGVSSRDASGKFPLPLQECGNRLDGFGEADKYDDLILAIVSTGGYQLEKSHLHSEWEDVAGQARGSGGSEWGQGREVNATDQLEEILERGRTNGGWGCLQIPVFPRKK
jgi:hypothetical protein